MPELPEVETLRRRLRGLAGRRVQRVRARDARIFEDPLNPGVLRTRLAGRTIREVDRRGKYLLLGLGGPYLLFSLRMTGRFVLGELPEDARPRQKLRLDFEGAPPLHFLSVRRLSRVHWMEPGSSAWEKKLGRLGPDPLRGPWNREDFEAQFQNRTGALKPLLMDQSFVAGLGNIYASELCFRVRVDPRHRVPDLGRGARRALHESLPILLREAVLAGGSSLLDFFDTHNRPGCYQRYHRVYDREGERCLSCGSSIRRIKQSGRSTFFCPICQT